MRGLFVSSDGISIRRIREAPPIFSALAHKPFVRTGADLPRRVIFYEQEMQPLTLAEAIGIAREKSLLDGMSQEARR